MLGVRLLLRGGHAYHTLHHANLRLATSCDVLLALLPALRDNLLHLCLHTRTHSYEIYTAGDRLRQDSELAAANSTGVKMKSLDSDDFLVATCLHLPIR